MSKHEFSTALASELQLPSDDGFCGNCGDPTEYPDGDWCDYCEFGEEEE